MSQRGRRAAGWEQCRAGCWHPDGMVGSEPPWELQAFPVQPVGWRCQLGRGASSLAAHRCLLITAPLRLLGLKSPLRLLAAPQPAEYPSRVVRAGWCRRAACTGSCLAADGDLHSSSSGRCLPRGSGLAATLQGPFLGSSGCY